MTDTLHDAEILTADEVRTFLCMDKPTITIQERCEPDLAKQVEALRIILNSSMRNTNHGREPLPAPEMVRSKFC